MRKSTCRHLRVSVYDIMAFIMAHCRVLTPGCFSREYDHPRPGARQQYAGGKLEGVGLPAVACP
jgi:hypothetical protein